MAMQPSVPSVLEKLEARVRSPGTLGAFPKMGGATGKRRNDESERGTAYEEDEMLREDQTRLQEQHEFEEASAQANSERTLEERSEQEAGASGMNEAWSFAEN